MFDDSHNNDYSCLDSTQHDMVLDYSDIVVAMQLHSNSSMYHCMDSFHWLIISHSNWWHCLCN